MGRPRRSSTPLGGKAPADSSEGAALDEGASSKVHATPTELPPSACAQSVSAVPSDATNVPIGVTGKQPPMTPRIRVRSATEAQQPGPLTARWDAMASVGATRSLCSGKLQRVLYSVALENARVAGTSAAQRGIARRQLMGVRPSLHAPDTASYMRMLCVGRHLEADRQNHLHMRSTSPVMVYARSGGELKRLPPKEAIRVPAVVPDVESSTSAAPLQPTADCDSGAAALSGVQVDVVRADFAKFLQQHRQEWLVCELRHSDPCVLSSAARSKRTGRCGRPAMPIGVSAPRPCRPV